MLFLFINKTGELLHCTNHHDIYFAYFKFNVGQLHVVSVLPNEYTGVYVNKKSTKLNQPFELYDSFAEVFTLDHTGDLAVTELLNKTCRNKECTFFSTNGTLLQ